MSDMQGRGTLDELMASAQAEDPAAMDSSPCTRDANASFTSSESWTTR